MENRKLIKFATRQSFPPIILLLQYRAALDLKKWVGVGLSDCIAVWDGVKTDLYYIQEELDTLQGPVLKFLGSPDYLVFIDQLDKVLKQYEAAVGEGDLDKAFQVFVSDSICVVGTIVSSISSKFWESELTPVMLERALEFRERWDKVSMPPTEAVLAYLDKNKLSHFIDLSMQPVPEATGKRFVFSKGKFESITFGDFCQQNNFFVEEHKIDKTDDIKGVKAYGGLCRGIVKVIFDTKEFSKINKGDILVTSMTKPSFIPVFSLVSAIVTDEGGTLCHAAIVARELKKPCIIGTKIATQVLKDGDLVEVDADKGIVRILEKAK